MDVHIEAVATGRRLAIPEANGKFDTVQILDKVEYRIKGADGTPKTFVNANGKEVEMTFTIDIVPGRGWKVTYNLPSGAIPKKMPMSGTF